MKKLLLAGMAVFALSAPAFAADMPVKAPPPAPIAAFDWSGWYIGGDVGWQGSRIGLSDPSAGATLTYKPHHDSVAFGGFGGVQRQFGQSVLGIEGGYLAASGRASLGTTPGIDIFFPGGTATAQAKLRDIWSVGGRAGWAMGNWMPYITVGYGNGSFEFDAQNLPLGGTTQQARSSNGGAYVGGGVDLAVMNNWIFGIEYRHYFFNAKTVTGVTNFGGTEPIRFDPSTDTVVARLSYKFDWGKAPVVAKY